MTETSKTLFIPGIMRLALYQPDIPQNTGTILRLCACLGVPVDIIEPCGFALSDRSLRRAGLDYIGKAELRRHESWADFLEARGAPPLSPRPGRLVLLTTGANQAYTQFVFDTNDTLLLGRESAGVPQEVHERVDARLCIPMMPGRRALNVATAAAMVLGEALRQTAQFPSPA